MLLPDIRLHNKKYSRFYSITDERKRKVLNVKKHGFFCRKTQKVQSDTIEIQWLHDEPLSAERGYMPVREVEVSLRCIWSRSSGATMLSRLKEQIGMRLRTHNCDERFSLLHPCAPSHCSLRISSTPAIFAPFPEIKSAKFGFFCIFIGFHLQIPLLSRIMKQDYIGVVGRAA